MRNTGSHIVLRKLDGVTAEVRQPKGEGVDPRSPQMRIEILSDAE